MKFKKVYLIALLFIGIVLSIPKYEFAATYGDWEYEVSDSNEVTITRYNGSDTEITIPSTINEKEVTKIATMTFCEKLLETITIPSSITNIEEAPIYSCMGLEEIIVEEGNEFYGNNNQDGILYKKENGIVKEIVKVPNISTYEIPNTITKIGDGAFENCGRLKKIDIPSNVKTIGMSAFESCGSLEEVILNAGIEEIGYSAFYASGLKKIDIPDSVTTIGTKSSVIVDCWGLSEWENTDVLVSYVFGNCSKLETVKLPKNLTIIGIGMFFKCSRLKSITIPETVTIIGDSAFTACGLESIKIPDSVTKLGYDEELYRGSYYEYYIENVDGSVFASCNNLKNVELSKNLTTIKYRTFEGCWQLTNIYIPKNITYIGDRAFLYCKCLTVDKDSYAEQYAKEKEYDYIYFGNDIENFNISNFENITYTGESIVQDIILKNGTTLLVKGTDYEVEYENNINAGTATVIIKGKGNYTGTITKTFKITAKDMSKAAVSGIKNQKYTGQPLTQNIKVRVDGTELRNGIDYIVEYKNNAKPGKATVTIKGIGSYIGQITKTFIITPKKVNELKVKEQTTKSIKLNWSKHEGVTGYRVYSYNYKKSKWEYVGKTSSTSYTIKKLKNGTTYKYRVRAYKTIDGKQYYGEYSSNIKTSTKTKTPSIIELTTKNKKATLEWKKISGASGYEIYMAKSKKGKYSKIKTIKNGKTTDYTKSKLKKNKKYYFKIRTYRTVDGKKIYSSYSSVKSIKVK